MPTWAMPLLFGLHVAALVVLFVIGWQFWLTLSNLHPTHDDSPREMPKLD